MYTYYTCRGAYSVSHGAWPPILHVEYGGGRINYGILSRFSPFYEYSYLKYVHVHVTYRVHQAESVIRIRVAASQEYANTYSTCRPPTLE